MDPQTITVLTSTAVGILSSYLAKAGESAAKKIGEDIYDVLKGRFEKKPAAQEVLTDLEKSPEDTDIQGAMRIQLKKLLQEDEAFATQLQETLTKAGKTEAGATIIQQHAGDNATQIGQIYGDVKF